MYLYVDNRSLEGFSVVPSLDLAGINSTTHFLSTEVGGAELDPGVRMADIGLH